MLESSLIFWNVLLFAVSNPSVVFGPLEDATIIVTLVFVRYDFGISAWDLKEKSTVG